MAFSPRQAFNLGRGRQPGFLEFWERAIGKSRINLPFWFDDTIHPTEDVLVKEMVMARALLAKFFQNPKVLYKLLSTRNSTLIEHTEKDHYWGDDGDGSGSNRLGVWLMQIRAFVWYLYYQRDIAL